MAEDELERLRRVRMDELRRAAEPEPPAPESAAAETPQGIEDLDDASFQAFISKNPVVLVDFWAPWCAPCRTVAPIVESVADDWNGKVAVGKLNTDENPQTSAIHRVQSIPTLIVFKGGRPHTRLVGVQPRSRFEQVLREATGDSRTTRIRRL